MKQKKFRFNRRFVLGFTMALLGSVLHAGYSDAEHRAQYVQNSGRMIIAVELVPIHGFLAEYDRFAILTTNGKEAVKKKLFRDSGGYASANLYRCGQAVYMLKGYFDSWIIDSNTRTIEEGECKASKAVYLGIFEGGGKRPWKFYPSAEREEAKLEPERQ
jgi:hypothetical protein